ncbi:MurR/RpiR family transcriptional regulator [Pseudoleptotrichia goodfellowii]|uniref:Transcriptional regulator n=1 Tax=Pseudoleptotrichia goodfellowii TaxID=157692 RepID=A0A510J9D3_9FUSO|nr:MurR/RpiR family transcriptional regulator [Pseudoleptotrichia goodfellowii]BBM35807.1 transcriptional regulator [Pseudoleptotrichia goodfellowii]
MSILIKLRENKDFTANEEDIAKYIIKNFRNIRELDTNIIAAKTYTSNASVTRMCKKIGFNGFQDFKMKMIEEVVSLENQEINFENSDIDKKDSTTIIIEKLNKLSISSLQETKLLQEVSMIDSVVDLITEKEVIDFYGIGASHIVCLDAQYKFMRAGKIVNTFEGSDLQHVQAVNSNLKHLAILISYSGLTKEILDIAEILQEKEIETVSITGYGNNKLVKKCKYNLYVTSREALIRSAAIYSRISMLNLIDVLYFVYYNKNYDYVSEKIIKTKINKI